jgi:hypothetical protein
MWPGRALSGGFRGSARRPAGVADDMVGRHGVSAGTVLQRDVHVARRRRPASPCPEYGRTASRSRERHRRTLVIGAADGQVSCRSETRGTRSVPHRVPVGPVLRLRRSGKPCRRCRTRLRLPGGSARCTRARRRWVEARIVVRHSRSAAGSAPSEGSQVAAEIGLQAADVLGDRAVGHGHPGKRATGRGVLRMERRTASSGWLPWSRNSIRSGAGERPSRRRRAGPYGNELRKEPGDLDLRAGTGEPRAG